MYDTTRQSLHHWFKHLFEHLGWMVLCKSRSVDESNSEQERTLCKNKVELYCDEITGFLIALDEKKATLVDVDSKNDLDVLSKEAKILKKFVSATLMGAGVQMGGKRRSKKSKKSKKVSKK